MVAMLGNMKFYFGFEHITKRCREEMCDYTLHPLVNGRMHTGRCELLGENSHKLVHSNIQDAVIWVSALTVRPNVKSIGRRSKRLEDKIFDIVYAKIRREARPALVLSASDLEHYYVVFDKLLHIEVSCTQIPTREFVVGPEHV